MINKQQLSHVQLLRPWTIAYQVSLSMGFPRQEPWSGLSFPFPGDLLDPGIKLACPEFQAKFSILQCFTISQSFTHIISYNSRITSFLSIVLLLTLLHFLFPLVITSLFSISMSLLLFNFIIAFYFLDATYKWYLEKEMATHSSILVWRIPWTEESGGLQFTGSQTVRHN